MSGVGAVDHDHAPVFRVLRAGHTNPLDVSHSRARPGRWNTPDFPALYSCCSETSAKAVARDRFNLAAVALDDLQPDAHPQLFELEWRGSVADVASPEGLSAAEFPASYPEGAPRERTQLRAAEWRRDGLQGVVCRSASLFRLGFSDWSGDHARWGELAIFVDIAQTQVTLRRKRADLDWLN